MFGMIGKMAGAMPAAMGMGGARKAVPAQAMPQKQMPSMGGMGAAGAALGGMFAPSQPQQQQQPMMGGAFASNPVFQALMQRLGPKMAQGAPAMGAGAAMGVPKARGGFLGF